MTERLWKAGDLAMVKIVMSDEMADFYIELRGGRPFWIPAACLYPLPPADPHAELKDAVIAVALVLEKNPSAVAIMPLVGRLNAATRVLRIAMTPPDPVKELRDAWNDFQNLSDGALIVGPSSRLERAIAAIEAARVGAKP